MRAPELGTFYTDDGIFPRSALAETTPTLARWSLHAASGSVWVQALLVGLTVILAACLLVGYRPRLAAIGSALLLASLYARNPSLANGGDTILVSVLLFAAFLPLEARWSLRRRSHQNDDPILSVATATVLTGSNWLWTAVLSASVLLVATTGWLRTTPVVAFTGAHLSMAIPHQRATAACG